MGGTYFGWYYSTIKQMKNWCENNNEKRFLNDYIQTIDHFYKDAKWQQNQSYIIHESCSANQQNVTLHVKNDHQYRRNFKSLNIIWCIVFFSAFIEMHDCFSQEIRPPFSMLNTKRFEIVYALHHIYIMHSNVKNPSDVT